MIKYKEMGLTKEDVIIALFNKTSLESIKNHILSIGGFRPLTMDLAKRITANKDGINNYASLLHIEFKTGGVIDATGYDAINGRNAAVNALNGYVNGLKDGSTVGA